MNNDQMQALADAITEHSGMDDEQIIEAGQYGADTGWPGFTYTVDGADFYREHSELIDELLADTADDMGYNVAQLVASFTRADMADTRNGRDCLLAWFALEECGRWLADRGELVAELPVLTSCDSCGYAMSELGQPSDVCHNPCCMANPSLSEATRAMIQERHDRYVADELERAERMRLYKSSFARASA